MNSQLRKCKSCGTYTLEEMCPKCGLGPTTSPHPPKFSPDDKYLRFRLAERYAEGKKGVEEGREAPAETGEGAK